MTKLLLLLSMSTMTVGAAVPIINSIHVDPKDKTHIVTKEDNTDQEKIDLRDVKVDDYIFNVGDETDIEVIKQIVLVEAGLNSSDPKAYDFMLDLALNPDNYTIMDGIDEIPETGQKIEFDYTVLAQPTNELYEGLINFKITLTKEVEQESIDLTQIKDIIENQFKVIEFNEPIDDEKFIETVLAELDRKLVELGVPMYGHSDLLEWGYETNQLDVQVQSTGDETNNSGFYAEKIITLSVIDAPYNLFEPIEDIIFQTGSQLKEKINISSYGQWVPNFEQETFSKLFISSDGTPDIVELLNVFDQYLLKNSDDETVIQSAGRLFSTEYAKNRLNIEIGDPVIQPKYRVTYEITLSGNEDSHIFSINGGILAFNITYNLDDVALIANPNINYAKEDKLDTSWWMKETVDKSEEFNVLKWTDYADTWDQFATRYGSGENAKRLNIGISGLGKTDFYSETPLSRLYTEQSIPEGTVVSVDLATISEQRTDHKNDGQYISMDDREGTSRVAAEFWVTTWHDAEYIKMNVHFYLEIGSFQDRYVDMKGNVNNVEFVDAI